MNTSISMTILGRNLIIRYLPGIEIGQENSLPRALSYPFILRKNTFFFQIIIHFWVNLGAFCQKLGKPEVYPPKSSSFLVQHSCPSNIYERSGKQICQSGENWVQTNTLRGTPALHKGSINLFTRMVTPWLAFYLNRNIIFSAIYLFCYFIKNGQIKFNKLKWAKLFVKYVYIIRLFLFHKKPDDVNIFYEKLCSF